MERFYLKKPATADNTVFVANVSLHKLACANFTNTETVTGILVKRKQCFLKELENCALKNDYPKKN